MSERDGSGGSRLAPAPPQHRAVAKHLSATDQASESPAASGSSHLPRRVLVSGCRGGLGGRDTEISRAALALAIAIAIAIAIVVPTAAAGVHRRECCG